MILQSSLPTYQYLAISTLSMCGFKIFKSQVVRLLCLPSWKWKNWGRTKRSFSKMLPSRKRTWQWTISLQYIFKTQLFHCHVSYLGCYFYISQKISAFFAQETFRSRYHLCSRGPLVQPWRGSELLVAYPYPKTYIFRVFSSNKWLEI